MINSGWINKMGGNNYKSPPVIKEGLLYSEWKKELAIWSDFTDLEKKKQGGALFLTLTGVVNMGEYYGLVGSVQTTEPPNEDH